MGDREPPHRIYTVADYARTDGWRLRKKYNIIRNNVVLRSIQIRRANTGHGHRPWDNLRTVSAK